MRYVVVYDMVLGVFPYHLCKFEIFENFESANDRRREFNKSINAMHKDTVLKCLVESYECRIYEETEH